MEPGKFSPRAQKFTDEWNMYDDGHDDGYIYDDYAVNTEMGARENVNLSHRDASGHPTFHAPVISSEMQLIWSRSRVLQPIGTTYFPEPRKSPRSQGSVKPKSKGSSGASSRASGVDFNWLGDFMAKFVDETANSEKRDLDLMRELLRKKRMFK